jgi:hypothetical protein
MEICRELIRWSALVAIFYMVFLCVQSLAGKITTADIAIRALGNIKVSNGILALVQVVGLMDLGSGGLGENLLNVTLLTKTV